MFEEDDNISPRSLVFRGTNWNSLRIKSIRWLFKRSVSERGGPSNVISDRSRFSALGRFGQRSEQLHHAMQRMVRMAFSWISEDYSRQHRLLQNCSTDRLSNECSRTGPHWHFATRCRSSSERSGRNFHGHGDLRGRYYEHSSSLRSSMSSWMV